MSCRYFILVCREVGQSWGEERVCEQHGKEQDEASSTEATSVMDVFIFACMHVYAPHARRSLQIPGTGIPYGYELPSDCWEWNLGPIEEQPELLTAELQSFSGGWFKLMELLAKIPGSLGYESM